jgi:hypothetical protein
VTVRPVYRGEESGLRPWHLLSIGYVIARIAYRRLTPDGLAPAAPPRRTRALLRGEYPLPQEPV